MLHLYDKMAWTVIEDRTVLDGAGLEVTQKTFRKWLDGEGGKKDMEGSVFADEGVVYRGRGIFFFCLWMRRVWRVWLMKRRQRRGRGMLVTPPHHPVLACVAC